MSTSVVQICNMAISRVGQSQAINALTERSKPAQVCTLFYEPVRDRVLREFDWPFATAYATLALIAETPNDDWDYVYQLPADCMKVRRMVTALGRSDPNRTAFALGQDAGGSGGRVLYTSMETAKIEYTAKAEDPALFDPLFASALAWLLATEIAAPLTGDDKWRVRAAQFYGNEIAAARVAAAREHLSDETGPSSFERARY